MGNRQQQILEEIKSMVTLLKGQVEELEKKLDELQLVKEPESEVVQDEIYEESIEDVMEMEVSLDIMDIEAASVPDMRPELEDVSLKEFEPAPEEVPVEESEPEPEDMPEPVILSEAKNLSEDLPADDDLPFFDEPAGEPFAEPDAAVAPEEYPLYPAFCEEQAASMAVIDAMTAKQAWRTDMPGTSVRDIRSAISLNDRILFINYLFNEDPMAFQETLTALNSMTSFDEAVNLVVARHPEWNLESDTVYRFMMALRRRLQ